MEIQIHTVGNTTISEVISNDIIIRTADDVLDIMASAPSAYLALHDYNFEKDFFDLSTRKLGEVFQKFANYNVKVAIIGDFSKYPSATLKDFIYESNKHKDFLFVESIEEVKKMWKDHPLP